MENLPLHSPVYLALSQTLCSPASVGHSEGQSSWLGKSASAPLIEGPYRSTKIKTTIYILFTNYRKKRIDIIHIKFVREIEEDKT